jgi:ubiquinone/menaquinone biosynthesis C-methylase UbiE
MEQKIAMPAIWVRIIRFGFRLLYNEFAWIYDVISWMVSLGQWRLWQKAALPYLSGKSVLEVAHGPGHMLLEVESRGYDVIGLDLSPYMTRMASRRLQRQNSAVNLLRAKAQQIPFPNATFDSILSTFPTIFILEPATLAEFHRIIQPGGRVVIVPQARLTGSGIIYKFIEWLYLITGQQPIPGEKQLSSQNWYRARESFSSAGFSITVEYEDLRKSIVTIMIAEKDLESD